MHEFNAKYIPAVVGRVGSKIHVAVELTYNGRTTVGVSCGSRKMGSIRMASKGAKVNCKKCLERYGDKLTEGQK